MVADVNKLKSHPDKLLFEHIEGVVENVKRLTDLKSTELVAKFHDLGKINPNFQKKLSGIKVEEYANHSYLSAYAFFCAFAPLPENREILSNWLNKKVNGNDLIALTTIIAKHHGNIPDFTPKDETGTGASILNKDENERLFNFLSKEKNLPVEEFTKHYFSDIKSFYSFIENQIVQKKFKEEFIFTPKQNNSPLDYFLDTQFSFASLVQSDKVDAAKFGNFIDSNSKNVDLFCENYYETLTSYINKLNQDSELNKLRTAIRLDAVEKIRNGLNQNKQIFELTAPTGSGKTLMMLSLASEIIEQEGAKRIIYSLPFLSITEQVEVEVLKIFSNKKQYVQRIDSKSQNKTFEDLQNELEKNPTKEVLKKINMIEFQENTFSYPFIITTFVRFFETLLSNRNADLLKLPNFANSIFLIDEIQALPPRLYTFFTAYLSRFCEKNGSFAIISTATQPNFNLPEKDEIKNFFSNYTKPFRLLSLGYFQNELFNRYRIIIDKKGTDIMELKEQLLKSEKSVLVILNTIDDTKDLYSLLIEAGLSKQDTLLLNTHISPKHRKIKIYLAKRRLRENKKVILVSTQLIEAGVDIDFPILYRDMATVSSIVQSAGRCNRNGKLKEKGIVNLIRFKKNGKERANLIYRGGNKELLIFTKQSLQSVEYQEKELLDVQEIFFDRILKELHFAKHIQQDPKQNFDFLKDIKEAQFDKIGQFHLIDKGIFGEEMHYYIPKNNNDKSFELLNKYIEELDEVFKSNIRNWDIIRPLKTKIKIYRKKMSENIVQIRLKKGQLKPITNNVTNDGGLHEIALSSYSFENGVDLQGEDVWL
jgi:CRISPR-associated endonuclease/helicase Cas3